MGMARAIWSGTVGFGLVQIPVTVHGAEDKDELDMHMLDRRDFSPIGYERVNKKTGKEVAWKDIVKGYEHAKGEYVVLTDEDFKRANSEASSQIDISDFVEFSEIDPRYFDRPYYLAPQKNGKKAYALLREILQRTGKAGIGKVVLRTRQHLAAIVAHERTLLLVLLRFADELRKESDLDLPESNLKKLGITEKELAMAEKLVSGMVEPFKPDKYEDKYRSDLMKLIQRKVKAGEVNQLPSGKKVPAERPAPKQELDLSALLAQSLQGGAKRANGARHKAANENARTRKSSSRSTRKSAHTETRHRKSA
jgi:DNA end-binding protein Ku